MASLMRVYHPETIVLPCTNCAALGHHAAMCDNSPQCYLCGGPHHGRNCTEKRFRRCALCGGDHPARHHRCPAKVRYEADLLEGRAAMPDRFATGPRAIEEDKEDRKRETPLCNTWDVDSDDVTLDEEVSSGTESPRVGTAKRLLQEEDEGRR